MPEQHAIAHILGMLDDKIELNQRMNDTLEAIARAIFKSWFVDFDPVIDNALRAGKPLPDELEEKAARRREVFARARAEGRLAGLPEHLARLFPDEFEESEVGWIPKGWKVVDIYSVAEVIYGAPFKSVLFNDDGEGLPIIRIRDLSTYDPKVYTTERPPRAYQVEPGDVIVGMDGEFRAHLWQGPRAWLNQRLCCFKPRSGIPRAFIYLSIEEPLRFFEEAKTGTTVIHLGKADIDTFCVLLPPTDTLTLFGTQVEPLYSRIMSNAAQSRSLAALRDALLPKLISGKLWVKDAERIVESGLWRERYERLAGGYYVSVKLNPPGTITRFIGKSPSRTPTE
ncbi:restriction endonuclease subunit S, partial [Moorella naiadis]|uniref:restriction endonuclease subunit S n=1 Tax=Moorella naiadis (nom. illeg.) TaxID=3093670 RepID=UPI003D9C7CF9